MVDNEKRTGADAQSGIPEKGGFWGLYGSKIITAILVGYVILLGIGVAAELFKIQWILDWWIWSPPGKFK